MSIWDSPFRKIRETGIRDSGIRDIGILGKRPFRDNGVRDIGFGKRYIREIGIREFVL